MILSFSLSLKDAAGAQRIKFRDEKGVTTVAMAISIFLAVSLIFSGAQLYRVSSASAEIQEVADACVLAADNEVAEFVCAVNVCDAVILSFTLLSGTLYGLGIVTACIPPLEALSQKLISVADKSLEMRDRFHDSVVDGLNQLQRLLPFLAAANSMGVAQANNAGALQADYYAIAALMPSKGVEFSKIKDDSLALLAEDVDSSIDSIREDSAAAEEAAKKANEAKRKAFEYDCGNAPGACMYERAQRLAGLSDSENPLYTNVDAWSLQVPLNRARAYYAARLASEAPTSAGVEAQADSALRSRFYTYAQSEFEKAYVSDTEDFFSMSLPHLFRNTDEMRATELYTEAIYPVTETSEGTTMHAWPGCPGASGFSRSGSISELDGGGFTTCPYCKFVVSSMGKVASASTSVSTGFEHHYELMRKAAEEYAQARAELDPLKQAVKSAVEPMMEALGGIFEGAAAHRLEVDPPGKFGVVSVVVNTAHRPADTGFESLFVGGGSTLGTCAAVSGATLLADESSEGPSVITRIAQGLEFDGGGIAGAVDIAASCWSGLLKVYEDGQNAFRESVETGLNAFSTNTESGLGNWVADALMSVVDAAGLAPADTKSRMPVLVNTAYPASADSGSFAASFMQAKQSALDGSAPTTTLMSMLAGKVSGDIQERVQTDWIAVADLELPFGGDSFTIEMVLPEAVGRSGSGLLDTCISVIGASIESISGTRSWQ